MAGRLGLTASGMRIVILMMMMLLALTRARDCNITSSVSSTVGATVTLPCLARSWLCPLKVVSWFRDKHPNETQEVMHFVRNARRVADSRYDGRISLVSSGPDYRSLVLAHVGVNDSGAYGCLSTWGCAHEDVYSCEAVRLHVATGCKAAASLTVSSAVRESASLPCGVPRANCSLRSASWWFTGDASDAGPSPSLLLTLVGDVPTFRASQRGHRFAAATSVPGRASLVISDVNSDDAGHYRCLSEWTCADGRESTCEDLQLEVGSGDLRLEVAEEPVASSFVMLVSVMFVVTIMAVVTVIASIVCCFRRYRRVTNQEAPPPQNYESMGRKEIIYDRMETSQLQTWDLETFSQREAGATEVHE